MDIDIRHATVRDKEEILDLLTKSQTATTIPNPEVYPPSELKKFLYHTRVYEDHRYVATAKNTGRILCHAVMEQPNPLHIPRWVAGLVTNSNNLKLVELGGFFVDPEFEGQGIMTQLLNFQLEVVRKTMNAKPVSATWIHSEYNERIKRMFRKVGGIHVGTDNSQLLDLFVL
jgi:GNAT superfamily N-acetyltransferase